MITPRACGPSVSSAASANCGAMRTWGSSGAAAIAATRRRERPGLPPPHGGPWPWHVRFLWLGACDSPPGWMQPESGSGRLAPALSSEKGLESLVHKEVRVRVPALAPWRIHATLSVPFGALRPADPARARESGPCRRSGGRSRSYGGPDGADRREPLAELLAGWAAHRVRVGPHRGAAGMAGLVAGG